MIEIEFRAYYQGIGMLYKAKEAKRWKIFIELPKQAIKDNVC